MNLSPANLWWAVCGVAVAAELVTGSLYLLMIGIGSAAGAVAASLGCGLTVQVVVAALVGGLATALWRRQRSRLAPGPAPDADPGVNQDIGARVQVAAWAPDRSARVDYRGTTWSARLRADQPASPGTHVVAAVQGNWLVLVPAQADALPAVDPLTSR